MKTLAILSPLFSAVHSIPATSTYQKPHDNYYFCSHLEEYVLGADAEKIISYCNSI